MSTKRRMSAFLPPTPCTEEMRGKLLDEAKKQGRSLADLQREAISLFLSQSDTKSIEKDTGFIKEFAS